MTVWGISDLHLSFAREDPRERFAGRWRDHAETIGRNWREVVAPGDLVLIPGDVSMARNHRELQPDLAWLDHLPGTKVLSPGNHDGWWNTTAKVRPMLRRSLRAVGGDAIEVHGMIVCGTLGSAVAGENSPEAAKTAQDRELSALDRSLAEADRLRGSLALPLIVLWHYPPFDPHGRPGPAVARLESAGVSACVYGHLHAQSQWGLAVHGVVNGVRYACVAADAVGFRPLRLF